VLQFQRRPETGVFAHRKVAADDQKLVVAQVVGDLIGETQASIGVGVEAVQVLGSQEKLKSPGCAAELDAERNIFTAGNWRVGRRPRDRSLADFRVEA